MDAGHCADALPRCRALLEREPLVPRGHFYQALLLERTAAHAEAEQSLRRAIYLDRSFVLAHYCLAQLQRRRGDAESARRSFTNVLRLLESVAHPQILADADGLTAGELLKLTEMHLELLP
jgi:chemotaxis protein methyltransferase CheR